MVIEERPKDANRNGANTALRPRTSRRRDEMRAARRRNFVDRARSIWHESRSVRTMTSARVELRSFAMRAARGRSSIITAHAKMQFKLQVHVISRSRRGKRFRPAVGGRRSVSNDPIKRIRAALLHRPRHSNARPAHRYIHHDPVPLHKRGNVAEMRCAPVAGEKGNATFVTRTLRHSRKHK